MVNGNALNAHVFGGIWSTSNGDTWEALDHPLPKCFVGHLVVDRDVVLHGPISCLFNEGTPDPSDRSIL